MTSRQLVAWQSRHARRASAWWTRSEVVAIALGGLLALWVGTRGSVDGASHAWMAGVVGVFAVAYLRVPFHVYWRADAAFLAQLPLDGGALFDSAAWRCAQAAIATTLIAVIGALPLLLAGDGGGELFARHVALAGALGAAAAGLVPAAATWGATLVSATDGSMTGGMRVAAALATASPTGASIAATSAKPPAPSALLGAMPGFMATVVIVLAVIEMRWLTGGEPAASPLLVLGGLAAASAVAWLAVRAIAPRHMATILRDVSALDRQRLAMLEIRPLTAIERGVASLLGSAALPYRKDARLVRRRYPMAFALGALTFGVLAVVGLARPDEPTPWLVAALAGSAAYAASLWWRIGRPPIELPRLSATLPLTPSAIGRAKIAWLAAWWLVFVGVPAAFALIRTAG